MLARAISSYTLMETQVVISTAARERILARTVILVEQQSAISVTHVTSRLNKKRM